MISKNFAVVALSTCRAYYVVADNIVRASSNMKSINKNFYHKHDNIEKVGLKL